ncbi:hypothetical protein M0804_003700 [Polistes exclamans]|nr:hypothetical protein M0804_003700 [Polistes exclamans]
MAFTPWDWDRISYSYECRTSSSRVPLDSCNDTSFRLGTTRLFVRTLRAPTTAQRQKGNGATVSSKDVYHGGGVSERPLLATGAQNFATRSHAPGTPARYLNWGPFCHGNVGSPLCLALLSWNPCQNPTIGRSSSHLINNPPTMSTPSGSQLINDPWEASQCRCPLHDPRQLSKEFLI